MPTLVYSPGVEIHIATVTGDVIDVTADIVSGSVTRRTNGVSGAQFRLSNPGRKYDGMFCPMDRIVIYMRRIKRLLVFSGYLDVVPSFEVFPGTVDFQASCTLKRLQNWYWDSHTEAARRVLYDQANAQNRSDLPDGGLAQRLINLLTEVVGWPKSKIHIGQVPSKWFDVVADVANSMVSAAEKQAMVNQVGAGTYTAGQGGFPSFTPIPGGQGTGYLPDTSGTISIFGAEAGGPLSIGYPNETTRNPHDQWYMAMRFPYVKPTDNRYHPAAAYLDGDSGAGANTAAAMNWWRNRKILVVNPKNNKGVVLRAASWGPNPVVGKGRVADLSTAGAQAIGASTDTTVCNFAFAPEDWPLGPVGSNSGQVLAQTPGLTEAFRNVGVRGSAVAFADTAAKIINTAHPRYEYGAEARLDDESPNALDCSELVQVAHYQCGAGEFVDGSKNQWGKVKPISVEQAIKTKGALLFVSSNGQQSGCHHVAISMGDGTTSEAQSTKTGVGFFDATRRHWSYAGLVPDLDYTGATGTGSGGTVTNGLPGSGTATGTAPAQTAEDIRLGTQAAAPGVLDPTNPGEALFNVFQWIGSTDFSGELLGGIRALMNDDPIFKDVAMLMGSGLREFSSAPNGDYIAWFPDYFGHYGTAARFIVNPIELTNFAVGWSDASMRTHWFVTSAPTGVEGMPYDRTVQMFTTAGIASVEFPELMRAMFNIDPKHDKFLDSDFILRHFGARPETTEMANITGPRQEFFFAVFKFMESWASQYSARVPTTFLPELFPGMLFTVPAYGFQAYVREVTHTFDLAGTGFGTTPTLIAPSSIGSTGPKGLPRGGTLSAGQDRAVRESQRYQPEASVRPSSPVPMGFRRD